MRRLLRAIVPFLLLAAVLPWLPLLLNATDPLPARADALFVFAGDVPARPRCAAELYAKGVAPRVVFGGGRIAPELEAVERPMTDAAVDATVVLPEGTSTWEDAGVLRRWAEKEDAQSVVAVTSPLHSRRARMTLDLVTRATGIPIAVVTCGEPLSPGSLWWLDERPLVQVTNEALKLGLYLVRYVVPVRLGLRPPPGDAASPPAI